MSLQGIDEFALKIKVTPEGDWVVENLQERVKKATRSISDDFSRADKSLGNWMKNMAAAALLFVGFQSAASEIKGVIRDTIAFDTELTQVTTLIDTSTVNVGNMTDGLYEMAGAMGTVGELTKGVYQEISASVAPEKALGELTEAAKAAAGGQAALSDTVNLGTTVWNVYGDAARNMTHVYDVMWQVVKDGKSNMAQLSAYMGEFIPLAKEAGLTFEQASGALAIMSQISGKVNISVTQLKAIMQGVIKPTKEASDEAERIGINFSTAAIKTQGFEAWLKNLLIAVKNNNGDMSKLFGSVEGLSGILQLSRNNLQNFNAEMVKMGQVYGNNQANFEKYENSLKGSLEAFLNQLKAAFISNLMPVLKQIATFLRENKEELIGFIKGVVNVIGFAVKMGVEIGSIAGKVVELAGGFKTLAITIGTVFVYTKISAFTAALGATNLVFGVLNLNVSTFVLAMKAGITGMAGANTMLTIQIGLVKAAAAAWGLIQKAIPIIVLAAAVKYFLELNDTIKQIAKQYDEEIKAELRHNEAVNKNILKLKEMRDGLGLTGAEMQALREKARQTWGEFSDQGVEAARIMQLVGKGMAGAELQKRYEEWKKGQEGVKAATQLSSEAIEAQNKAIEEHKKAIESLAGEMGILTEQGYVELLKKSGLLAELFETNKTKFQESEKSLGLLREQVWNVIETFGGWENIPPVVRSLWEEINKLYLAAVPTSSAMKDLASWTQHLNTKTGEMTTVMPGVNENIMLFEVNLKKSGKAANNTAKESGNLAQTFQAIAENGGNAIGILQDMGIISSGLANTLQGVTRGAGAIGSGLEAITKAGEKGGFIGFLGKISGGISVFSGALSVGMGLIKGFISLLAGKSGELKAAERILSGLGDAAKGFAEQIEKLAKELGGSGSAERAFGEYMSEIFGNMPSTISNFNMMFSKMMDYGAAVQWAGISMEEASKNYGKAFTELLRAAQDTGQVGGDKFLYVIENAEKLGLKCKEITEYVETKTKSAFSGWQAATKQFGDINIPIFKNMQRELDIIASIPPEIQAGIEGLTKSVIDYSDAHRLTVEEFQQFNQAATTAIQQLRNQNKTNEEIAISMAPLLQRLAFLQSEFGFEVDATTQELIDQARNMGLLEGDYRDGNQIMKEGFGEVTQAIHELSAAIRGDFVESVTGAAGQVRASTGEMVNQIGKVEGSVRSTNDEIKAMGDNIRGVDGEFIRSISGNTILVEIHKMQEGILDTTDYTLRLGQAIIPVHDQWINSSAAMQDYLTGIQDRIKELIDIIDAYGDDLSELEEQEKALYEAELAQLQALLDAREAALGISEELNSIQFNPNNFADGIRSIYDVFKALNDGIITTKEAANELGDSFNVMIQNAKDLGMEGSASLLQFMRDVEASGVNVPEIRQYKTGQLNTGNNALKDYFSTFANTSAIRANIADLEAELKDASGVRIQEIEAEIAEQRGLLNQGIEDIKKNADSMGIYTLGMFNSMLENGSSYMDAMKEMGPQLGQLKNLYKEAGIEVSGPLKEMLDMQEFIEQQGTLADRISASTKMLQAFGNTGNLTKEIFNQFQTDAAAQFKELVDKTGDTKKAYQLLGPELAKMLWYSEQYGYNLDANTQKMIGEAQAQGVNLKAMIPAEEKMVALLERLVELWGGEIPYAPGTPGEKEIEIQGAVKEPLSAARGASFIVPPGYETGFPMLVHPGELVQVFPAEETTRIMDMMKYQPLFEDQKENLPDRPAGDSPISVNIFKESEDDFKEFTESMKTPGTITGNQSPGGEPVVITNTIERITVTFENKPGGTIKEEDLEEFSRKFKKVIVDNVKEAAVVGAAEFKRRMR